MAATDNHSNQRPGIANAIYRCGLDMLATPVSTFDFAVFDAMVIGVFVSISSALPMPRARVVPVFGLQSAENPDDCFRSDL
ncbi:hypothetical protein ACFQUU_12900 [Herbaspirillum sp. GCM10030257]|uniref:hypothetical protein n=1 Tax=Herbaspirillum sp. GCM10030257 TaxID=3273393 RepID=UPI00361CC6E7